MNITATQARKDFFSLIKNSIEKHEIQHIRHTGGDVVMLSSEDFDNMQETLELLSIPDFRDKLKQSVKEAEQGDTVSFDEVFNV